MVISFLAIFLCNIHGSMPAAATFSYGQHGKRADISEQLQKNSRKNRKSNQKFPLEGMERI